MSENGSSERGVEPKRIYKLDDKLELYPSMSSWKMIAHVSPEKVMSIFPYLNEFSLLAFIAYEDYKTKGQNHSAAVFKVSDLKNLEDNLSEMAIEKDSTPNLTTRWLHGIFASPWWIWQSLRGIKPLDEKKEVTSREMSKIGGVPPGFQFLAEAKNLSKANGYYGVAYINNDKKQIILSHRGTNPTTFGAIWTDAKSIWWGSYTSQVSSAMTFSHKVVQFANENGYQVFFTGHSLGAWLAQITCFSTKYLTVDNTDHFIRKSPELWDDLHPYTVVFDSPGAFQFLQKMKNDLFSLNDPKSQAINVSCLPVEVFQFYPNTVNKQNIQIGSVYLVDLQNTKIDYSYSLFNVPKLLTLKTHSIEPVVDMFSKNAGNTEDKVLKSQVVDWRIENWEDFLHKWRHEGRSVSVQLNRFPIYFLTSEELDFLKQLKNKPEGGGSYEGLSFKEEENANNLVKHVRRSQMEENGTLQLGVNLDRREVIPIVRHILEIFKKGRIWWNGRKPTLPTNYIERTVCSSSQIHFDYQLEIRKGLILLVDPPGMGKSSAMTHLELKLRKMIPRNRIILRINLNEVQTALSAISNKNSAEVLFELAPFVPLNALQMSGVHLRVLLDGLDEVCPTHQNAMINLLRTLRPTRLTSEDVRHQVSSIVIVTMRPHLKNTMESAFNLKSFSLVPLEIEEQDKYIQAELGVTAEGLTEIRDKFKDSLEVLLSYPLMLSMLVDILKSRGSLSSTTAINIYDLYSRFISSKHQLHLVKKKRMVAGDNFTELEMKTMLTRNLRYYFHVAWNELFSISSEGFQHNKLPAAFQELIVSVAEDPPSEIVAELLSFGLLIQNNEDRLIFKHLSFAEFFYAKLLFHPKTPQEVRDFLFGFIYGGMLVLYNVEAFVAAASTKTNLMSNFHLTPKWLRTSEYFYPSCIQVSRFVKGKLCPLFLPHVLLTFVNGVPEDLSDAFHELVHRSNREAFAKVFDWMRRNEEWSRKNLFKTTGDESPKYSAAVARLIVAIEVIFGNGDLFTKDDVSEGLKSCDDLLLTMASIQNNERNKWEILEVVFGKSKFRNLVETANSKDIHALMHSDTETLWKLCATFSREELFILMGNEDTRKSDAVGEDPLSVLVAFGEDFIPQKSHLAQLTSKFGSKKGKTVFELGGCDFTLEFLWEDLLKEADEKNPEGPITVVLREALARDGGSSFELIQKLEKQIRRRRKCPRDSDKLVSVTEWLVNAGSLWNKLTSFEFEILPFLLLHSASADEITKLFRHYESINLEDEQTVMLLLKSLALSSHQDNSTNFSKTKTFLQQNLRRISPKWRSFTQTFTSFEKGLLKASLQLHRYLLLSDISVGGLFVALIQETSTVEEFPWVEIVSDVIRSTRCCDFFVTLTKLRLLNPENKLREILLSEQVLKEWQTRYSSEDRKEADYECGLRNLLSFYFDVFDPNLDWMTVDGLILSEGIQRSPPLSVNVQRYLVFGLPVEIVTVLKGNWAQLVPQFEEMLSNIISTYGFSIIDLFHYKTEGEWERLLRMFSMEEKDLQEASLNTRMPDACAVPFVRVLMRKFPLLENKKECLRKFMQNNHPDQADSSDSMKSKASLLHLLIELEDVKQVERYAFPGLLRWRNSEGKIALDVAKEKLGDDHQITRHLQNCFKILIQSSNPT